MFLLALGLSFPAAADQTDPRLDSLFEELRVGDEINGFKVVSINSDGVQVAWEAN